MGLEAKCVNSIISTKSRRFQFVGFQDAPSRPIVMYLNLICEIRFAKNFEISGFKVQSD